MEYFAGVDVGSLSTDAVIVDQDEKMIAYSVVETGANSTDAANKALDLACQKAGVPRDQIARIVSTGYGRVAVPGAHKKITEITCHGVGSAYLFPTAQTVIDIGGQDSKVIKLDSNGKVVQYSYNDKCAAGTGRFLEIMADSLGLSLEEIGLAGDTFKEKLTISNQCVIFAETEVVSLVNEEKDPGDILNALFRAMANRVCSQARSLTIENDVVMTGGVAKNIGVFNALCQSMGTAIKTITDLDPQINGALGAALLAQEA